jgi:hypothetical protein
VLEPDAVANADSYRNANADSNRDTLDNCDTHTKSNCDGDSASDTNTIADANAKSNSYTFACPSSGHEYLNAIAR